MALLYLDEYIIFELFKYLDIESRKNLSLTCQRFQNYSKYNVAYWKIIEDDLRKQLVECLCNPHDRDNVPHNLEYQYTVSMALKYFLQVTDICQCIKKNSTLKKARESPTSSATETILWNAIETPIEFGLSHLVKLGQQSHIDFNHWYMFNNAPGKFIYLCNAKHPDQKIIRSSSVGDVIMGIVYDANMCRSKFSVCLSSKYDWFGQIDEVSDLVEFSNHNFVLQNICKLISKNLNLPKGSMTTVKLYEIIQSSWLDQNRFPEIRNPSETVKKMKSRFSKEIHNLGVDGKEFCRLIENLKLYANLTSFKRRDFIVSLIDLVLPIGKAINIFDYGELLCYIPLVQALLTKTQRSKNETVQTELVQISLNDNTTLSSLVSYHKVSAMDYTLKLNNKLLFHFVNRNKDNTLPIESVKEIVAVFENFIESNKDRSIFEKIPTISMSIIFQFFRCLHTIEIHLLDEIMLKI